jgi:hypothetical protein
LQIVRLAILAALLIFCLFYGAAFALFAPNLLVPFAVPLIMLALLVVWALPDAARAPTAALEVLFYGFVISIVAWPYYIAIVIPGLPWLTLIRAIGFPLAAIFLLCLATSVDVRRYLVSVIRSNRNAFTLLALFVGCQFFTIFLSKHPASSIQRFFIYQVDWTLLLFVSLLHFRFPGKVEVWGGLLWGLGLFVSSIGLLEYKMHQVPWNGHLPGFLRVDPAYLANATRAYVNVLRVRSTFGGPLGFAEYLAIAFPFVLHFAVKGHQVWIRWAAAATLPLFILMIILTDARLGMVGCFFTIVLYPLILALRSWRERPGGFVGPSVVLFYPFALCAAVASTFLVGTLKRHVWGGGGQAASTSARVAQYQLGLPKIWSNPIGHGPGEGAFTLGYAPYGLLTIDTYYLDVALEYGIIGFVAYYGLIAVSIFNAGVTSLVDASDDVDRPFLAPLALSLVSFFIIKSVFSQQDNHPLIFIMIGVVAAVYTRVQRNVGLGLRRRPTH